MQLQGCQWWSGRESPVREARKRIGTPLARARRFAYPQYSTMHRRSPDRPERRAIASGRGVSSPWQDHPVLRADSSNTRHFLEQCRSSYGLSGETDLARWIHVHPSLPARVYLKDPVTYLLPGAASRAVSQALDTIAEETGRRGGDPEIRWLLWGPPHQDAVQAALVEAGFSHRVECPGMTRTHLSPETTSSSPLVVTRVSTPEQASEWAGVYTDANGFPEAVRSGFHDALPEVWSERSESEWFIGRNEGEPVACIKLRLEDDGKTCGLYQLATLERFRRRGFAAHMLMSAMDYARDHGYAAALLQSEPHAAALYERVGFTRDCTMAVWIRPAVE